MLPVLAAASPNTCRCGANSASFVAAPEWRVRGCQSALSLVAKRWARRVAGLRNVRDVQHVREILRNSRTQCTSRTNTLAGTRLIGCLFVASWSLVLAKPGVVAKLNGLYGASAPHDDSREWRNWQTRWLQVPVLERAWGFKSPLAHEGWLSFCGLALYEISSNGRRSSNLRPFVVSKRCLPCGLPLFRPGAAVRECSRARRIAPHSRGWFGAIQFG